MSDVQGGGVVCSQVIRPKACCWKRVWWAAMFVVGTMEEGDGVDDGGGRTNKVGKAGWLGS